MRKGFSLVEVLVVLATAALLIFGASAAFVNSSPKYRLKRASWEVYARLNYARHRAIFEGRPVRVRFRRGGYLVEKLDASLNEWRPDISAALEGVKVEANNSPIFYPVGTVSNLATILLSNSWGECRITLAISGRVKVAMP